MKRRLIQWLACPACGGDLSLHPSRTQEAPSWHAHWASGEPKDDLEILEGSLQCACGASYPVVEGIPRLLPQGGVAGPGTGHRWTEFQEAVPQFEENFLDLSQPLQPADWAGKLVLDAGCGFGRHAFFAGRYGAEVVAFDHSPEAVASARKNLGEAMRTHVVQGDMMHPPFKKGVFDVVYSYGVLHHLNDARAAFRVLDELVRAGGRLSMWVYGPRQGLTRIVTGALRGATAQMTPEQLHNFSRLIAVNLRLFSHAPYVYFGALPGLKGVVSHLPVHDHHRWPFGVVVADVYDRLRVPVTGYFTGEELERWYAEAGYADMQVSRKVGNNESFRATGIKR